MMVTLGEARGLSLGGISAASPWGYIFTSPECALQGNFGRIIRVPLITTRHKWILTSLFSANKVWRVVLSHVRHTSKLYWSFHSFLEAFVKLLAFAETRVEQLVCSMSFRFQPSPWSWRSYLKLFSALSSSGRRIKSLVFSVYLSCPLFCKSAVIFGNNHKGKNRGLRLWQSVSPTFVWSKPALICHGFVQK